MQLNGEIRTRRSIDRSIYGVYQMLWGALLTVRRMVMRPPASAPEGRETRAWPRKLVVWCSADAAIFFVSGEHDEHTGLVSEGDCFSLAEWWEWPVREEIFIRPGTGARGEATGGRAARHVAGEPIGCHRAPLDIARRGGQWLAARWRGRSPRPKPQIQSYLDRTAQPAYHGRWAKRPLCTTSRYVLSLMYLPLVKT